MPNDSVVLLIFFPKQHSLRDCSSMLQHRVRLDGTKPERLCVAVECVALNNQ